MPITYPPNPDQLWSAITLPTDGDLASAASLIALQSNFDTVYSVLKRLQHPTQPGSGLRARANGFKIDGVTASDTTVILQSVAVVVIDTAVRFLTMNGPTQIDEENLEFPGTFTDNTCYYVYVKFFIDTNAALEISTTAPDDLLLFKNGGTTHRYLFSFITDGTAKVKKFNQFRGTHILHTPIQLVDAAPTTATDIDFSSAPIPAYARMVIVQSIIVETGGVAPGNLRIGTKGDDIAGASEGMLITVGISGQTNMNYEIPISESGFLTHKANASTTFHELLLRGWTQ